MSSSQIKINMDQFSIQKGKDFIDVHIYHIENWLELKIETTESFPIESQEELDFIYEKLTEAFKSLNKNNENNR